MPWPGDETVESTTAAVTEDSGFWGDQAREFDWGD